MQLWLDYFYRPQYLHHQPNNFFLFFWQCIEMSHNKKLVLEYTSKENLKLSCKTNNVFTCNDYSFHTSQFNWDVNFNFSLISIFFFLNSLFITGFPFRSVWLFCPLVEITENCMLCHYQLIPWSFRGLIFWEHQTTFKVGTFILLDTCIFFFFFLLRWCFKTVNKPYVSPLVASVS